MDQKKRKEDSNSEDDDCVGERKENKKKQLKKAIHPQKSANEDHAVDADLHLGLALSVSMHQVSFRKNLRFGRTS